MNENRLKQLRHERNFTVRELGEKANINYAVISNIENNKSILNEDYIYTLCKVFNVSSDYLLGLSDVRNLKKELQINAIPNYTPLQKEILNKLLKLTEDDLYMLDGMIDNLLSRQTPGHRKVK